MKYLFYSLLFMLTVEVQADTRKFQDWQVECSASGCAALTYKTGGSVKGYPSLKIKGSGKNRSFILANAEILDGTKPLRIQVDGDFPFHLLPEVDFKAISDHEYVVVNGDLGKELMPMMIAGGKLWITYTNKRGEPRVPQYSLMGMTASLRALAN